MGVYGTQSDLKEANEAPATADAVTKPLILDLLPILTNVVAQTMGHLNAQPQKGIPLFQPRFLEHPPFHVSASPVPDAEMATGSALPQTQHVWMLQCSINRTYNTPEQKQARNAWVRRQNMDGVAGLCREVDCEWMTSWKRYK